MSANNDFSKDFKKLSPMTFYSATDICAPKPTPRRTLIRGLSFGSGGVVSSFFKLIVIAAVVFAAYLYFSRHS